MPDLDDPQGPVMRFHREISDTLRAVQLGQIPEAQYDAEVDGILKKQLPQWDAKVFPFVIPSPDLDAIMGMVKAGRTALDNWIDAGRPAVTTPYWK